jgi:peptidoglycan/LPS O-acetylase OafA/YrhL
MEAGARNRLSGIELLRFTAAFAVLVAHYNHFYIYGTTPQNFSIEGQPLFGVFRLFYGYGTRAVEVFWCLSGFIFFHKYAEVIGAKRIPFRDFFWLRFSRLYPLHLLTLMAVGVLQWAYRRMYGVYFVVELNNLKHFVLNLFFAQYWGFQDGFSFNSPSWSVSVEVLVYLFFFLVTFCFRGDLFMVLTCLLVCVGADHYLGAEPVVLRCIFYFYLGGLSCVLLRDFIRRLGPSRSRILLAPGLALLACAAYEFAVSGDVDWLLNLGTPVLLAVLAILSGLVAVRVAVALDALGNLTYASYMTHFPLQLCVMLLVGALHAGPSFAYSPWFLAAYLAGVIGISHLVFTCVEMPLQRMIRARALPRGRDPNGTGARAGDHSTGRI